MNIVFKCRLFGHCYYLLCIHLFQAVAISDILIVCCKSERLHGDVFQFLAAVSDTYCHHFSAELVQFGRTLSHEDMLESFCHGPAVIVFHETQYAETLAKGLQYDSLATY